VESVNQVLQRLTVALAIAALIAVPVLPAGGGGRATDAPAAAQPESDYVTVQLVDSQVASYAGGIPGYARTKPERGKKLNLNSNAARAYGRYLADKRQNYKQWLRSNAPRAQVVREFSVAFNGFTIKLNGEGQNKLAQGPGTRRVSPSFLVRPAMNVSPALINADDLWAALGGPSSAGTDIKVGIIDTGIDTTNLFLSPAGYPTTTTTDMCAPFLKPGGGARVNNKVIVCRVYTSGVAPGAHVDLDDLIVFDHGTHVAGTVAGNFGTSGTVAGTSVGLTGLSGIAPRALLGDYNVFPGFGAGFVAFGGSAFSHDIIRALEDAIADGMDVVNLSLGGPVQGPHDTLAEAVNATADAGVVPAVAAGNSGPGDATVESPGSAAGALTAGASTNPHFIGIPVTVVSATDTETFGGAVGDFNPYNPPVAGQLLDWDTIDGAATGIACTALGSGTAAGKIALVRRGTCTFSTKIRNAQNAGAAGVLVVNNVVGDPVAMAQDGTPDQPTIPAVMMSLADRTSLVTLAAGGATATGNGTSPAEFVTGNADFIAGFSSRGPTPFTFLIKPDATAPGVNVASSVFDGKFAFFQGTSMATPHLAGSSAVLLQFFQGVYGSNPVLPYTDIVKSAIVNTAKRPVGSSSTGAALTNPLARGGGRVDLLAAKDAKAFFRPVSVSFGLWMGSRPIAASRSVTVMNSSTSSTRTYTVSVATASPAALSAGVSVTTSVGTGFVTLAPEGVATFTVNLSIARTAVSGDRFGDIVVTDTTSGAVMRIPWWVRVDRGP